MAIEDIVKVFLPTTISFIAGVAITPIISHYLYKFQAWKKKPGKIGMDGNEATIFNGLHQHKDTGTPRFGGMVVWGAVLLTALGLWIIPYIIPTELFVKLDFVSRTQTWIPLAALLVGAFVGFIDDLLTVRGVSDSGKKGGGLSLTKRLLVVGVLGVLAGAWFYYKLDVHTINIPIINDYDLGLWFIAIFTLIVIAVYSGSVIDGIDGLSGGVLASAFAAYAGIAFYQQQIDLAAFCGVVVGGILAFLWFNIPPARFYMSETGMMGLTVALAIVAFMTDSLGNGRGIMVLPLVAFPLVITTASDLIQICSKKFRGKKVFLVAPVHHHFEALGWPPYKVTMRYWIVAIICAILGMALALVI